MPKPLAASGAITSTFLNDLTGVIDRSTSEVDVVSSVVETTIYSKSIAAGSMSTDRSVRCAIIGDILNNTGGNQNITFKITFGGTTIYEGTQAFPSNATRNALFVSFVLANLGSASSQFLQGSHTPGGTPTAFSTGSGAIGFVTEFMLRGIAINTALAKTLAVTVTLGASSASLSCRKEYASLELL